MPGQSRAAGDGGVGSTKLGEGNGCGKRTQARLRKERRKQGLCAGEWWRHTAYSLGANVMSTDASIKNDSISF